jgi:hypothetical protein
MSSVFQRETSIDDRTACEELGAFLTEREEEEGQVPANAAATR